MARTSVSANGPSASFAGGSKLGGSMCVVAAAVEARLLRERVATRSARMAVEGQRSWWSK